MKIALSLIRRFIDLGRSVEEISDVLTSLGIETEDILYKDSLFSKVKVAKIVEVKKHPKKDHLLSLKVQTEKDNIFSVVCGDTTLKLHDMVAYAMVGSKIPKVKDSLQKKDFGGVISEGMLCTEDELQLGDEKKHVIRLDRSFHRGDDLASKTLDPVFNMALTPNLCHCQSAYGIARELGAFFKKPIKPYKTEKKSNKASDICYHYSLLEAKNIKIAPSPIWLQWALKKMGFKPINNVVDAIHYVTLLYGQPMHAFDGTKIKGDLKVALSDKSEDVIFLDGIKRSVPKGSIAIFDSEKMVALAGIMGGLETAVSTDTTKVLIEVASFNPQNIRETAKKNGIYSESSARFERGVDPNLAPLAIRSLESLLGTLIPDIEILGAKTSIHSNSTKTLKLFFQNVQDVYGAKIGSDFIATTLKNLHFGIKKQDSFLEVDVPNFRFDIFSEIDLIEEIIRHKGIDANLEAEKPYLASDIPDSPFHLLKSKARQKLLNLGLQELLTVNLISKEQKPLINLMGFSPITVDHTKNQEYTILRPTHMVSHLQAVKKNPFCNVSFFEVGMVHRKNDDIAEIPVVSITLSDFEKNQSLHKESSPRDFFELKGFVEGFAKRFSTKLSFIPSQAKYMHPFCQAYIISNDNNIGICGRVHPGVLDKFDLKYPVLFAEFALEPFETPPKKFQPIIKTPSSERDWTVTVSKSITFDRFEMAISKYQSTLLESFFLLDIFESDTIGDDKKNVTIRFTYRDSEKTLLNNDVDMLHNKLCKDIQNDLSS